MDKEDKLDEVYRAAIKTGAILPRVERMVSKHEERLDSVEQFQAKLAGAIAIITGIGTPLFVFLLNK